MQVGRIPFNQQIQNFELTVGQIAGSAAASIVARSIVFVGMGSNDYLNNYIIPNYETRRHYTPQQFADLLVTQYASQLTVRYRSKPCRHVCSCLEVGTELNDQVSPTDGCMQRLFKAGARRFVVAGVGSMGCIPTILARSAEGRCSEEVNRRKSISALGVELAREALGHEELGTLQARGGIGRAPSRCRGCRGGRD